MPNMTKHGCAFITTLPSNFLCINQINTLHECLKGHKGFIAGGCFKDLIRRFPPKDIDIFFECEEDYNFAFELFLHNTQYTLVKTMDKVQVFRHKIAGMRLELNGIRFGTPFEILDNFDFTLTKFAYGDDMCLYHYRFHNHLINRLIHIDNKIISPFSTFRRLSRYVKYGYYPDKQTELKLAIALKDSNLNESKEEEYADGQER